MGRLTVLALRAVIVMLLAGSLGVQTVMVPLLASDLEGLDAEYGYLRAPLLLVVVLFVVTAQTVLVCVWRLVTMARLGTVFSHAAFRYVHIVIGAFVAAALLVFTLGALLAPGEAVAPGIVLLLGGAGLAVLGIALVVLVLRMLLAQAVARDVEASRMQAELAEVI
ncbi:transporter [Streptomyces malachitofuscus]|nr:transporter [Streptomyces malachitofuscus]